MSQDLTWITSSCYHKMTSALAEGFFCVQNFEIFLKNKGLNLEPQDQDHTHLYLFHRKFHDESENSNEIDEFDNFLEKFENLT